MLQAQSWHSSSTAQGSSLGLFPSAENAFPLLVWFTRVEVYLSCSLSFSFSLFLHHQHHRGLRPTLPVPPRATLGLALFPRRGGHWCPCRLLPFPRSFAHRHVSQSPGMWDAGHPHGFSKLAVHSTVNSDWLRDQQLCCVKPIYHQLRVWESFSVTFYVAIQCAAISPAHWDILKLIMLIH